MGKGDKKTKRGKIIIGSFGVSRPSRKKKSVAQPVAKAEPKPKKSEVDEKLVPPAKAAPKKSTKKAEEHLETAEEKPKTSKSRKKTSEGEVESHDTPAETVQE